MKVHIPNWNSALCAIFYLSGASVQAADFADDFESGSLNTTRFQMQVGEGELSAGRVLLSANSNDGDWYEGDLNLTEYSDYLEGELTLLSNASLPASRSEVGARINMYAYNTEAEGGNDGRTGDVQIDLQLSVDGRGQRAAMYCMSRSLDADGNDSEPVMGDEDCISFPVLVEYDRAYRAAIAVDRNATTVTFKLDGHIQVVDVTSEMYTSSRSDARLGVFANRNGVGQASVDNVRTAANALTDSELAAGLTTVPGFPAEPSGASFLADSSIDNPYDELSSASFVDDFSDPDSTSLGYHHYANAEGDPTSSVGYVDGAVQMAVHSPDGDYSSGELHVHDNGSDALHARLSLSSETSLPVEDEARAEVRIEATLFNDSFESPDSRNGDLNFALGLDQRGNGRFTFNYYGSRRNADGGSDDLELWDVSGFEVFDALQPTLDTVYDLSIELDRVRQVLVMSVDETSVEYPLTSIYAAYRSEMRIQIRHEGSSGRAIGRLHQLSTDALDFDFAEAVPTIAPFDPQWNSRFADSSIDWADERLTLTVDSSLQGNGRAVLGTRHRTDFIGADLQMSSNSQPEVGEENSLQVGGTLFNDTAPNTSAENDVQEGESFANVTLVDQGDGLYATYCYWRNNGTDWIEQISGSTDGCDNRFSTAVAYDTSYPASVHFDREGKKLVWSLNGEQQEYALTAGIFDTTANNYRVQLAATGENLAVGHVDNLRFGVDAPALADSPDRLLVDTDIDSDSGSSGGSSSGGGSIHPLFLLLIASFFGPSLKRGTGRFSRKI